MIQSPPPPISTRFTQMIGCDYPVIAAPMFLVSNQSMVSEASNAGGIGATPSLNWRTSTEFEKALQTIAASTAKPYAVNLIVNKNNARLDEDLAVVAAHKVPLIITSLGNPKKVIETVHAYGGKVFCDVTDMTYAKKVEGQGCDGVIAVAAGAGGHAGPVSPVVLIPYLRDNLDIPIVAAGGIATGKQILAAMILGADAVQIGTRFIASTEADVSDDYKKAILKSEPEDIVMTSRLSGTPAAVINTPYIQSLGLEMSSFQKFLRHNRYIGPYFKMFQHLREVRALEESVHKTTWKHVWSAGQGVGLIHDIQPTAKIMQSLVRDYWSVRDALKG